MLCRNIPQPRDPLCFIPPPPFSIEVNRNPASPPAWQAIAAGVAGPLPPMIPQGHKQI
jgi:hypothetical protein